MSKSGTLRGRVFERDSGQCAECRCKTEVQIEVAMHADGCTREEAIKAIAEYWGFGWGRTTLWEADHKLPRHRGGGDDLKNLQTLCLVCHAKKTRRIDVPAAAADRRKRKKFERHKQRMRDKFELETRHTTAPLGEDDAVRDDGGSRAPEKGEETGPACEGGNAAQTDSGAGS